MKWLLSRMALILVVSFFGLLITTSLVQAQTVRYVSDQLEVPLRAGASDQHQTLMTLTSGSRVNLLATDNNSDYSRVRTAEGRQGWIANRFLMDTPSARESLAKFQSENDELQKQLYALTLEKNNLDVECGQFRDEQQTLRQELAQIRKLASGDLDLDKQNQVLQQRVVQLERELQIVQQENSSLLESDEKSFFLMGAGVLGGGLILGLLLTRLGNRKREPWHEI